ncbi:formyl-CoA transferase [Chromatiales bacterium (ex Bugula neritina AB1)]|nr:formyl-CoA transferase [Chromatiales bacterium (ex Bugula neritina AB1)]
MTFDPASSILEPYTVLDLTRVRSGPTCVRQLADWGANVIKIEQPTRDTGNKGAMGGARDGPDFQNLHRNKRSITLNLKSESGIEIFRRLVADADVIVENYRPQVKHRLGIDYETLKQLNEKIVYVSISGFGQDGPSANRPGFDQIAQGMAGLMSITGEPGRGPMRVGIPIADLCAGIFAAQGALLALLQRERTGIGQWVQTSLLQAQTFLLDFQAARWLIDGEVPGQAGNNHPTSIPTGVFTTSDGFINIACAGQAIWERLRNTLKDPRLGADEFADAPLRSTNRDALNSILNEITATDTTENWINRLNSDGIPCGEINTIDKAFESAQMKHLGIARDMKSQERGDTQVVGQPIIMSDADSEIVRPPPLLGQHTNEVLSSLGYSPDEIEQFSAEGVT